MITMGILRGFAEFCAIKASFPSNASKRSGKRVNRVNSQVVLPGRDAESIDRLPSTQLTNTLHLEPLFPSTRPSQTTNFQQTAILHRTPPTIDNQRV